LDSQEETSWRFQHPESFQ